MFFITEAKVVSMFMMLQSQTTSFSEQGEVLSATSALRLLFTETFDSGKKIQKQFKNECVPLKFSLKSPRVNF